ncbi:hypothetical protein GCM10029964_051070 [Kibdelosporangium lantanae]
MTQDYENALIRRIGALAMADGPEGWIRVDLSVRVGRPHRLTVLMPDAPGQWLSGEPAPEITPLLDELRQLMTEAEDREWQAMRLVIEPSGDYVVHFGYDGLPDDLGQERWIRQELLFQLPPGWQWVQLRHDSGLLHMVTGETVPYTPPVGVVPEDAKVEMEHGGGIKVTYEAVSP